MNGMVSVPRDEVTRPQVLALPLPDCGLAGDASPRRVALSERCGLALSSAPWPIQLASGLVVVLLHLLVAEVLLRSPADPLSPPKPPVVAVRWMAAPQPAERQTPPVSQPPERTPPPQVAPMAQPAIKSKPKPKPIIKSTPRAEAPAEARPPPQASRPLAAAPVKEGVSTKPQAIPAMPIREPQYQSASLRNPAPSYPPLSRRFGEQGSVMLRVLVSATGEPLRVELVASSGYARLDAAARNMVAKWSFIPAQQGQEKVQAWVRVPVVFQLRRKS